MVYLAELLVATTVGLKIVRILAQNVPYIWTQALRQRRVSQICLSHSRKAPMLCSRCTRVLFSWNIKKSSLDNLHMSGSSL